MIIYSQWPANLLIGLLAIFSKLSIATTSTSTAFPDSLEIHKMQHSGNGCEFFNSNGKLTIFNSISSLGDRHGTLDIEFDRIGTDDQFSFLKLDYNANRTSESIGYADSHCNTEFKLSSRNKKKFRISIEKQYIKYNWKDPDGQFNANIVVSYDMRGQHGKKRTASTELWQRGISQDAIFVFNPPFTSTCTSTLTLAVGLRFILEGPTSSSKKPNSLLTTRVLDPVLANIELCE